MIFLDTCVWIELLGVRSPIKTHEKRQATAASELLETILTTKKKIITCKEQLIELVSAIEKVTMRTVNQERKTRTTRKSMGKMVKNVTSHKSPIGGCRSNPPLQ